MLFENNKINTKYLCSESRSYLQAILLNQGETGLPSQVSIDVLQNKLDSFSLSEQISPEYQKQLNLKTLLQFEKKHTETHKQNYEDAKIKENKRFLWAFLASTLTLVLAIALIVVLVAIPAVGVAIAAQGLCILLTLIPAMLPTMLAWFGFREAKKDTQEKYEKLEQASHILSEVENTLSTQTGLLEGIKVASTFPTHTSKGTNKDYIPQGGQKLGVQIAIENGDLSNVKNSQAAALVAIQQGKSDKRVEFFSASGSEETQASQTPSTSSLFSPSK